LIRAEDQRGVGSTEDVAGTSLADAFETTSADAARTTAPAQCFLQRRLRIGGGDRTARGAWAAARPADA
jgi:hypothetical protein